METTYEWIISAMDCRKSKQNQENIVNVVHWRLHGSRNGKTAETYGAITLPEPSGTTFTPFESLTKQQVVSWLTALMSKTPEAINGVQELSQLDRIKQSLEDNLLAQESPAKITLPPPFEN